MKRSTAINIISNFIYECGVEPEEADSEAVVLLEQLEKAGMIPGSFEMEEDGSWGTVSDVKDWYCLEGDFKWEPEDQ